jgi:hypothetical protein
MRGLAYISFERAQSPLDVGLQQANLLGRPALDQFQSYFQALGADAHVGQRCGQGIEMLDQPVGYLGVVLGCSA